MNIKQGFIVAINDAEKILTEINPIFGVLSPLVTAIDPKAANPVAKITGDLDMIMSIVANGAAMAQALTAIPGAPVLTPEQIGQALAPQIAQVVLSIEIIAGKKPNDSALFKTQCAEAAKLFTDIQANFNL